MKETWHSDLLNPLSKSFKALANKVVTQVNLQMLSVNKIFPNHFKIYNFSKDPRHHVVKYYFISKILL